MRKQIILIFFSVFGSLIGFGQDIKPLFSSDSILELTFMLPIDDLINDREIRNEYEAILTHNLLNDNKTSHEVKLKVRGKNRAKFETCDFPPLILDLKKDKVSNSIFEGQNKLKLVTHCRDSKSFQDYIFKEYLVYKLSLIHI